MRRVLQRYIHGVAGGEPLVWWENDAVAHYMHADRQGSIVATSSSEDGNGQVQTTPITYGPYGEPQTWAGSRFRYTGQIALPEAQLYYYKARVYDPATGRFLQTDPIGQADDPNLYAYVKGDPENKADPMGLAEGFQPPGLSGNMATALQAEFNTPERMWEIVTRAAVTAYANVMAFAVVPEAGVGEGALLSPWALRFSQTTAGGGGRYGALVASMKANGWVGPAIDAVKTPKGIATIDNTRVLAARAAKLEGIPVNVHGPGEALPKTMQGRFGSAKTWGEALAQRTGAQKPALPSTGSRIAPKVTGSGEAKSWDGTITQ